MATASERAGEAGKRRDRHAEPLQRRREGHGEHGAKRRPGGDAQREGRGERIAEQALEHDAGGSEGRPDQRAGERSRQPRDEEDLRVRIVRDRDRPVERAPQAYSGRPDERCGDEREQQQPAEEQYDAGETAAGGLHGGPGGPRRHDSEAARAVTDHVDVDVVERAHAFRCQDGFRRPGRQHPAVLQHHQRAAEPCRERQIVRRHDDGQCAIAVE